MFFLRHIYKKIYIYFFLYIYIYKSAGPWQCREFRRPWQVVLVAVASVPLARPLQPEPFLPPPNFPGELRGYQEPSGAKHRHRTGQPSGARHTGQDSPPGTGSPPGLARKLRLLLGMTRSQGPSQGPSATASTSATRGQAAGNGLRSHYKADKLH